MSNDILTYRGYSARVQYSAEDRVLYGKIEGIADLVNFESEDAAGIEEAFHEAVDDYLAFCEDIGKSPDKEYRGSFNVRIQPSLHRSLDRAAATEGISMNQYIEKALSSFMEKERSSAPYQTAAPVMPKLQDMTNSSWANTDRKNKVISFPNLTVKVEAQ